ncbi:MAG: hypothetical protein JWO04_4654 [Gammaproteobacteria bacterium]|jgi:hypothetical protein|nr:hypothetical protein [Gammaproteobacteria bacterium]
MPISLLTYERRRALRDRLGMCTAVTLAALALFGAAEVAFGQSVLDFDEWMQRIDRRSQSVQRNLAAGDGNAASADAREIGELYGSMEAYFSRRGSADNALKLSREGRELAATVVRSVAAKDFATASKAAVSIARACRACHLDYKPLD